METKRINSIDGLKGFLIFFVIFEHGLYFSLGLKSGVLSQLFELSAMPTFFFISGYFAKRGQHISNLRHQIISKFLHLVLPTIIIILIYNSYNTLCFLDTIKDFFWHGFWFLPTLFVIIFIDSWLQIILPNKSQQCFYLIIIFTSCLIMHYTWKEFGPISNCFCLRKSLEYIPYFYLGILFKQNKEKLLSFTDNKYLLESVYILLSIIVFIFTYLNLHNLVIFSYSRLIFSFFLFIMFYKSRIYWDNDNPINRIFIFLGKNSLGIYLIHYFFIPRHMQFLQPYIENDILLVITFASLISIATLIIVAGVIKLIRFSKILSFLLLGEKLV